MRKSYTYTSADPNFKYKILEFYKEEHVLMCLDSNQYHDIRHNAYDCIIAVGVYKSFQGPHLSEWENFLNENNDWCFGHAAYQQTENIFSIKEFNTSPIPWDISFWFVPKLVYTKQNNLWTVFTLKESKELFCEIEKIQLVKQEHCQSRASWVLNTLQHEYEKTVNKIINHIAQGDVYELNYCIHQTLENKDLDTLATFWEINESHAAPFSGYYRNKNLYLMCASPERFFCKRNNKICSQPIKGTIKRGENEDNDLYNKLWLSSNKKEKAENVMIVDLVRNDLAKVSEAGTVRVEELFKIYSFNTVHHLISTIESTLKNNTRNTDIWQAMFPMGSMTGAPKKKACELINIYEKKGRGLFSGSIGYKTPEGDLDFNVVIRSLQYNDSEKTTLLYSGSAITYTCQASKEWEECMLKAEALKNKIHYKNT